MCLQSSDSKLYWLYTFGGSQEVKLIIYIQKLNVYVMLSWEICMQVRKQQLEVDMEQQTGSK